MRAGTKARPVTREDEANIVMLYTVNLLKIREVCERVGREYGTVYMVLRRNNVRMRPSGRTGQKWYRKNSSVTP